MRFQNIISLLIIITAFFISCSSTPRNSTSFNSAPIQGKIFDSENFPCSDVLIVIDEKIKVKSDINGRFLVSKLKKGSHDFVLLKEGFEEKRFTYNFNNRNDVLWLEMISMDQLINKIKEFFNEKKWYEAKNYIERAEKIDIKDPVLTYLTAIFDLKNGYPEKSIVNLEKLLENGFAEPVVYLSLADIFQYELNEIEPALEYLQKYIAIKKDKEIVKRAEELKKILSEPRN